MRRPIDLTPAVAVLESDYDSFHADFMAFFPTIKEHLHGSL
jgi:uncharacterized damage-inducible protein DinB